MRPELGLFILDEHGAPQPLEDVVEWSRWRETHDPTLAVTSVRGWQVSTVFLGIDHRFGAAGPPVLWETMVFGPEPWDGAHWRYTSAGEARANHDQVAEHIRRGGAPDELD